MKQLSFLLALGLVLVSAVSNAQTSKEILDKLSAKAKTLKTIYSDFNSKLQDNKKNIDPKQDGSIKLTGQNYFLNLPGYVVMSDVKTVWRYHMKGSSCTIDNLEDVKDGSFDPSEMFTIWEKDFKHEMKNAAATVDGVACYEIALYPNNPKNKPYHTIIMYVDKAKMEVKKILVKTREGAEITYKVKNFKTSTDYPDTDFQFNKNNYPGVKVNDNRI